MKKLLFLILLAAALPAAAQTASLVADLNTDGGVPTSVSQVLLVSGTTPGKTFFVSFGPQSGPAPWVSDGTQAGTRMLTEACPDFCDHFRMLGALGGVALWISDQGFWRSDGTRPGTYRLDGAGLSLTGDGAFLGNAYITVGCHGASGCVPWRTDGTATGTYAIEDVPAGQRGKGAQSLTAAGSEVFFKRSVDSQETLWATDGTAAGTRQLAVIPPSPGFPGAWMKGLTAVGDRVFFGASSQEDDEVWTSDGTPAGTRTVTHFPQPIPFGVLGESFSLEASGERAYFRVENGPGVGIWRSDGTSQGTQQIASFPTAAAARKSTSDGSPDFVEEVAGGRAVFPGPGGLWVTDGNPATAAPLPCGGPCPALSSGTFLYSFGGRAVFVTDVNEIWGTDGTASGTHKLGSCTTFPCYSYQDLQAWPQGLGFVGFDAVHGTELWVTDGTPAGTRRLTDVPGRNLGVERAPVAASDGHRVVVLGPLGTDGKALWVADAAGTRLLAALPRDGGSSDPMDFQALPADPSSLVFTACAAGREVWRTDGTAAGTVALTSGSQDRCDAGTGDTGLGLTPAGGFLFFWRTDGFYARDLWRTDGTVPGTLRLTAGGNLQKNPMAAFQGRLFFAVNTSGGPAVWSSDGTPAGTAQAFQVPTSDGGAEITGLTALAGSLWFILPNQGDDRHSELWRSDGTPAGTVRIGGIPGAAPPLAVLGNQVFFLGQQPHNGLGSVWRTDGTPAGTYPLINNAYAGDGVFDHPQMAVAGGSLYFIARSASGPFPFRPTLYKSDGTPQGTVPLAPTAATSAVGLPLAHLTAAAGRLFFAADDGVHGVELWTSDGTAAGTRLVRDIAPGPASSNPDGLAAAGGLLYFAADDGVHGAELWRSDGTEAGTRLAQDIAPEADSSFPQLLTAAGGRLWLSADDGATGRELWSLPLATASACQPSPAHLCLGAGGRYQVEAAWHTAAGARGRGTAVALTADTGTFWFFSPTNVEAVVKVLDGTGVNGHVWVFYGALSNVEYTLTVTDTQTGLTRRYFNPQGQLASVGDVYGFGPLGANGASPHPPVTTAAPSPLPLVTEKTDRAATAPCRPGAQQLCLSGNRFAVTVTWKDFQGHTGKGTAVPLTADTGTFWFFNASNVELVVKALDGRPVNGHFWLFYGALSNVQYTLTVTDTQSGKIKTYTNPAGRFASVADTQAF